MMVVAEAFARFTRAGPAVLDAGDSAFVKGDGAACRGACAEHAVMPLQEVSEDNRRRDQDPGGDAAAKGGYGQQHGQPEYRQSSVGEKGVGPAPAPFFSTAGVQPLAVFGERAWHSPDCPSAWAARPGGRPPTAEAGDAAGQVICNSTKYILICFVSSAAERLATWPGRSSRPCTPAPCGQVSSCRRSASSPPRPGSAPSPLRQPTVASSPAASSSVRGAGGLVYASTRPARRCPSISARSPRASSTWLPAIPIRTCCPLSPPRSDE